MSLIDISTAGLLEPSGNKIVVLLIAIGLYRVPAVGSDYLPYWDDQ